MDKNSKIYIAGHNGMVGSAILRNLENKEYKNIVLKNSTELDLRRQQETEDFMLSEYPEFVFLAAAKVGGIVANNTYKGEFIYDNSMIAANLIHSSYRSGIKRLLNLGSSCIYPKYANQPMTEDQLLTGTLEPTNEPYAIAKIFAIKLCKYYREQYNSDFISLMPTNLYGENDNYDLEKSHVLPALLRKMILGKALMEGNFELIKKDINKRNIGWGYSAEQLNSSEKIIKALEKCGISENSVYIWGSGKVKREFMHSTDLADACLYFMNIDNTEKIGDFVNIGTGKDISISELANTIKEITGYKGKLDFDKSKPDGTPRKLMSVEKARSLGWEAKTELYNGIKSVYNNYMKYH